LKKAILLTAFVLGLCSLLFMSKVQASQITTGTLKKMPLAFTKNMGQWDDRVLFRANAEGATMWFTKEGVTYQFTRRIDRGSADSVSRLAKAVRPYDPANRFSKERDSVEQLVLTAKFVGANPNPEVIAEGQMEYKCNYFLGNDPTKWHTDVPNYEAITLKDIYPGIDLKYSGDDNGQAAYEFIAAPGADAAQIKIEYEGAEETSIDADGQLILKTKWSNMIAAIKTPTNGVLSGNASFSQLSEKTIGFEANGSNRQALGTLAVGLSYSTYLGGASDDYGEGIAVDLAGSAYVTGYTYSSNFPTQSPYSTSQGSNDVFVTKLSSTGNNLIYSTYLGGANSEQGYGIAVDGGGNAYVTGLTQSSNFPTLNPYQPTNHGIHNAFVTKLSSSGSSLIYSTYLGGGGYDYGYAIAVDGSGNAYLTGSTNSPDFPTVNAFQATFQGGLSWEDAFVTKLSNSGSSLIYSTYLSGGYSEYGYGIAVDGGGNAYVTGYTRSTNFPTQNPFQGTYGGGSYDVFVTKLSSAGNSLIYSTYLGGGSADAAYGIAVDVSGNAYVTGRTGSSNFPTLNPYQTQGSGNVFVTKLSSSGNNLVYSTYLGGGGDEIGYGIAVDGGGNAYVTGYTYSSNFPILHPYQTNQAGGDAFVTKLSNSGASLIYSTYLGGGGNDYGRGIAVDGSGNAYVAGYTGSYNFPIQNPFQATFQGGNYTFSDAFVTKLSGGSSSNQLPTANIDNINPNPAVVGASVALTGHGTDPDGSVVAYNWRSSIDGQLSSQAAFNTSSLSGGNHTIYFKVQDNGGAWSAEVHTSLVVNEAAAGAVPLVLIPGIMGTHLMYDDNGNEEEAWFNEDWAVYGPEAFFDMLKMLPSGMAGTDLRIHKGLVMGELSGDATFENAYKTLINAIQDINNGQTYIRNESFFVFPYDWRLPNYKMNVDSLNEFLDATIHSGQFDVIAHSMGGLIIKEWARLHPGRIRNCFLVAPPHNGSAESFRNLVFGRWVGYDWLRLGLSAAKSKDISINMISGYELLPDNSLEAKSNGLYCIFESGIRQCPDFRTLLPNRSFTQYISASNEKMTSPITGIAKPYIIGGGGHLTLVGFERRGELLIESKFTGDGTVPALSTTMGQGVQKDNIVFFLKKDGAPTHAGLCNFRPVIDFILGKLDLPQGSPSKEMVVAPVPYDSLPPIRYLNGSIAGKIQLHMYDQFGNHSGINDSGRYEFNIPGTEIAEYDSGVTFYCMDSTGIRLEILGTAQSQVRMYFATVVSTDTTSNPISEVETPSIPVEAGSKIVAFVSSDSTPADVKVDFNGDGTFEDTVATFDAGDVTPPQFTIDILRNPVLPFELDLFFYPSEPLNGLPEVTIASPAGSNGQTATQLSNRDAACYLTDYQVDQSGIYTITVCGTDLATNHGCDEESFSASRIFVGSGVELVSPKGTFRLNIPAGATRDNGLILFKERPISPSDLANTNIPAEITPILIVDLTSNVAISNKSALLSIDPHAPGISIGAGQTLVLISLASTQQQPIPTRINLATGQHIAELTELGSYVIGTTDVGKLETLPAAFRLDQNTPNPFNGVTTIPFSTGKQAHVTLEVFNVLGQRVATLLDRDMPPGNYSAPWDGKTESGAACSSGTYFYRLTAGSHLETKKMLYLK